MTGSTRRLGVAVVAGSALFILGIREGILLKDANDATARVRARGLASLVSVLGPHW